MRTASRNISLCVHILKVLRASSHGRIETRTYNIYDGLEIIADREKWGGNMTIIEYKVVHNQKVYRSVYF